MRCGLVVRTLDVGGVEEVVAMLARTLPTLGCEAPVLCTHGGGRVAERLARKGVSVTVGDGTPGSWRRWLSRERPAVCSTHAGELSTVEVLAEHVPVVETIHNAYAWYSPRDWDAERRKGTLVRATIAVSAQAAEYHRRRTDVRATHTIFNGVDADRMVLLDQVTARQRLGIARESSVLVHVGRCCPQKNQVGLVAGLAPLLDASPELQLLLVGDAPEPEYVSAVEARIAALRRPQAVRRLGHRTDVDVLYCAADLFVANSFFEGWSVAATEALWCGRPVVLSEAGAAQELVGAAGERGAIVPNPAGDPVALEWRDVVQPALRSVAQNASALLAAVQHMLDHRAQWHAAGAQIAYEARARWSARAMAERYLAVFHTLSGEAIASSTRAPDSPP